MAWRNILAFASMENCMLCFRTSLVHFEPDIFNFMFRIVNKNIKDNKIGRGINFVLIDSKI